MKTNNAGHFISVPGELSRSGVLDIGLKCTHSCNFCYYSYLDKSDSQFAGMRRAQFRKTDDLKSIVARLKENNFTSFDVTGGEPTIHPDIVEVVRYAENEQDLRVRVITLGQFLTRSSKRLAGEEGSLLRRLLNAGLTNILFSTHGATEREFREMTGESLSLQMQAQEELAALGFQYTTNTTVTEQNYKSLPRIAKLVAKYASYQHNFILMNSYYEWNKEGRAYGRQVKFSNAQPYLSEAIGILQEANVSSNIRYAPLCTMTSLAKHVVGVVGVRYDPNEWMNSESHGLDYSVDRSGAKWDIEKGSTQTEFQLVRAAGKIGQTNIPLARGAGVAKVFPEKCSVCMNISQCDGFEARYVGEFGDGEVSPSSYPTIANHVLLADRASYLPAFLMKRSQYADMKAINRRLFGGDALVDNPLVSVVITNYNYCQYVGRALDSVINQTWKNIEIIVVDDASTDGSVEFLKNHPAVRAGYVSLRQTTGLRQPAKSRNFGRKFASGDVLVFLDADDELMPSYVSQCVDVFRRHPEVFIAYSDVLGSKSGYLRAAEYDYGRLVYANQLNYCSAMRAEVFDEVGGYRENVIGVEDWDFWVAAGGLGFGAKRIPQALLYYREKEDGIYESMVRARIKEKFSQIVINNSQLYPSQVVADARAALQA